MNYPKVTQDSVADAAYVKFTETVPGEASETLRIVDRDGDLVGALDLNGEHRVLGLELLNVSERLPPVDGSLASPRITRKSAAAVVSVQFAEVVPVDVAETIRITDGEGDLVGVLELNGQGRVLGLELRNIAIRFPYPVP